MKLYNCTTPGDRTYSSVYSPTVKIILIDIIKYFNTFLHNFECYPYIHSIDNKRMVRLNLYSRKYYNHIHTYNNSEVFVEVYVADSYIEYYSIIAHRLLFLAKARNGKTISYHVRVPIGAYPRYRKKLKLKIGMVGY